MWWAWWTIRMSMSFWWWTWWTSEKFFISYRIRIYQLSKSTITKIQLSQQFALQWAFLYHSLSPITSSLYREFQRKDAQQFKSPMSREEEQTTVQISKNDKGRKLVSAKISYEQKRSKEQFESRDMSKERCSCLQNLQWWTVWAKKEARVCNSSNEQIISVKIHPMSQSWTKIHIEERGHTHIHTETHTHTYIEIFFSRIWKRNFSSLNWWT